MSLRPEQFLGAWSLIDWRIEYDDGRVTRPFGEDATGQLIYAPDGSMSATVCAARRPCFDVANARDATGAQKAHAFASYFHYAGTWRLEDDDLVVHAVEFALNPDMAGTEQRRHARFGGATTLTLSAREETGEGAGRQHILQWKRRHR